MIHINTVWRGRAKPGPWYGHYYEDCRVKEPGTGATAGHAAELWDRSEAWTSAG